jgi:SnoaL-like domain
LRPSDKYSNAVIVIEPAALQDLVARWWFNYDEGNFGVLASLLTDDVHFACRTDTGTTDFEDFVRADVRGRDDVMRWQSAHRLDSPYPLRHHGTNVHLGEQRGVEATFASYIHVTQVVDLQVVSIPGGIVRGAVRQETDALRISTLEVVLDTMTSQSFRDLRSLRS